MSKEDPQKHVEQLEEAVKGLCPAQLLEDVTDAKKWGRSHGLAPKKGGVIVSTQNTKLAKTGRDKDQEWEAWGLELAAGRSSGYSVCPTAVGERLGCLKYCLRSAGFGAFKPVTNARNRRTKLLFENPTHFMTLLVNDIRVLSCRAKAAGKRLAYRLNVLSDIPWFRIAPWLFDFFPEVQFYDYTKELSSLPSKATKLPENYHLTFSWHEKLSEKQMKGILGQGFNLALIFRGVTPAMTLPHEHWGYDVVDGDEDDLRFLDPQPAVVGLRAKGTLRSREGKGAVEAG